MQDHSTSTKKIVLAQNEHLYIANECPSILDQLQMDVPFEHKWKYMQFVVFIISLFMDVWW